jgi:glyoxylase-like metal-dependent hydrolase (beta-lactamase superfamily II)
LRVGSELDILFMHTPGHTPGATSYLVRDSIVAGDTLFVNGCGRCDFVGGDPRVMYQTLRTLVGKLPGSTVLYPGHNYGTTPTARLDEQLVSNPFLKLPTLEEFVAHRMAGKTPGTVLPEPPPWQPPAP